MVGYYSAILIWQQGESKSSMQLSEILEEVKMRIQQSLILFIAICLFSVPSYAVIWFDDGGVNDVNYVVTDEIQVWDNEAIPQATTVNFLNDFSSTYPVEVHLNSSINFYGGIFNSGLTTFDNSFTTIKGGLFDDTSLPLIMSYDNSIIKVEGGVFGNGISNCRVYMADYSKLFISADDFYSHQINLRNNTNAKISNGVISIFYLHDNSQVYFSNGTIGNIALYENAIATITGGAVDSIYSQDYGVVFIHGTHFSINGEYVGVGEITKADYANGTLTCKLFNGDLLNTEFNLLYSNDSRIILTSEPPEQPVYCLHKPSMDINNDCKTDINDFAVFASQWLSCGLSDQEACWE